MKGCDECWAAPGRGSDRGIQRWRATPARRYKASLPAPALMPPVARLPTQGRARGQALLHMSTVRQPNALPPNNCRTRRWLVGDHERRWTRPGAPNGRRLNLAKVSRVSVADLRTGLTVSDTAGIVEAFVDEVAPVSHRAWGSVSCPRETRSISNNSRASRSICGESQVEHA